MPDFCTLFVAWYKTKYRVTFPDREIDFILGEISPTIDDFLKSRGIDRWTMLTGWNPNSQVCSDEENERANQRLAEELNSRGLTFHRSAGVPETDDWVPEQGFFVANVSAREACELGQSYGQMAVLHGLTGSSPWLLFPDYTRYRDEIASVADDPSVEQVIRKVARETVERNRSLQEPA